MTHTQRMSRMPFSVRKPNQFDVSNHQPMLICKETKNLMPTIIRLAKLLAVADPEEQYKLQLNNQEELEVQIKAFRYLVNERHFPLLGYEENEFDELMQGTVDGWMTDDWTLGRIREIYHPLLGEIPVLAMGIPDHDIEPSDYSDVVGLLYWLGQCHPDPPRFDCGFKVDEHWSVDARERFKLVPILDILEQMDLRPPLTHLTGLIRSVLHETDTFFLDACPMCGPGPYLEWSVENFIWLRDDWRIAKPIISGNNELIKWANNASRLAEISTILKQAQRIHLFHYNEQLPSWCL